MSFLCSVCFWFSNLSQGNESYNHILQKEMRCSGFRFWISVTFLQVSEPFVSTLSENNSLYDSGYVLRVTRKCRHRLETSVSELSGLVCIKFCRTVVCVRRPLYAFVECQVLLTPKHFVQCSARVHIAILNFSWWHIKSHLISHRQCSRALMIQSECGHVYFQYLKKQCSWHG